MPEGLDVEELYAPGKRIALPKREGLSIFFNQADRLVKVWERRGIKDIRKSAIRDAEHWMLDRMRLSDGLGAIYPGIMYSIMAMDALGYEKDHPDLLEALHQFHNLILETEERLQFQPCVSPVWDTAIAMFALGEMGQAEPAAMTRAADWLLTKEVRRKGDWSVKRPDLNPGGWAFEFANEYYPDIDDTAMVLLAFRHAKASDPDKQARAERRAINWLLGHAIDRRWLGRVRCGQQLADAEQGAVCRPQRHAGSNVSGHYRACTGSTVQPWIYLQGPCHRESRAIPADQSEAGRKLVWTLGRQLCLRIVLGLARPAGKPAFRRRPGS